MVHTALSRWRHLCLTSVICAGVLLAACTRSASQSILPTATTPAGNSQVSEDNQDATMAAIATELTSQLTQTAQAVFGQGAEATVEQGTNPSGGGEVATSAAPTASVPGATETTVAVVSATPEPPAASAPCTSPYTVLDGDWIYKIARACGLDPQAIVDANPGIDPNNITPGQVITLPSGAASSTPAPIAGCTGVHTVVTGDTLFGLAYGCGFTAEELAAANGIAFPYTIFPGQELHFP